MSEDEGRPSARDAAGARLGGTGEPAEVATTPNRLARRLSLAGKALVLAAYVGAAAAALISPLDGPRAMFVVFGAAAACVLGAVTLFVTSYALTLREAYRGATVAVERGALVVAEARRRRVVPRSSVRACVRLADLGGAPASLERVWITLDTGDELMVRVHTRAAADALVEGLGFGADAPAQTLDLESRTGRLWHLLIAYGAYQVASLLAVPVAALVAVFSDPRFVAGVHLATGPVMLALYAAAVRWLRPARVSVGLDGVLVRSGRRETSMAWSDITAVEHTLPLGPAAIHTRSGTVRLFGRGVDLARRNAALDLVRVGLARRGRDRELTHHFERHGRTDPQWALAMAARGEVGHYRVAAPPDAAARVLESADASPEARLGAAMALSQEPGAAARIRVVSARVHDEALRVRLAALADGLERGDARRDEDDALRRRL